MSASALMPSARRANSSSFRRVAVSALLSVRARAEIESHDIVRIVLVQDRAPADLIHLLIGGLIDRGAAAKRRRRSGGAGRDAAQQRKRGPVPDSAPTLAVITRQSRTRGQTRGCRRRARGIPC